MKIEVDLTPEEVRERFTKFCTKASEHHTHSSNAGAIGFGLVLGLAIGSSFPDFGAAITEMLEVEGGGLEQWKQGFIRTVGGFAERGEQ